MADTAKDDAVVTGPKIKAVRKETRAGTIDCRKALEATAGNGGDAGSIRECAESLRPSCAAWRRAFKST